MLLTAQLPQKKSGHGAKAGQGGSDVGRRTSSAGVESLEGVGAWPEGSKTRCLGGTTERAQPGRPGRCSAGHLSVLPALGPQKSTCQQSSTEGEAQMIKIRR